MKQLLIVLILLSLAIPITAQETEPIIPVINHQVAIGDPSAEVIRAGTRDITNFGEAVEVSNDILVIGAPEEDVYIDGNLYRGAVYVYRQSGLDWVLQQRIETPKVVSDGVTSFGVALAIEGYQIAVSLLGDGVYIYAFNDGSGMWEHTDTIPDPSAQSHFGRVLAWEADVMAVVNFREVFIYRQIAGVWTLEDAFTGEPERPFDLFLYGASVDISDDGRLVAIGEPDQWYVGHEPLGAVYVHEFNGSDWTTQKLEEVGGDTFGISLDLLGAGDDVLLAVGSIGRYSYDPYTDIPGQVYLYSRLTGWGKTYQFASASEIPFEHFGTAVRLIGDMSSAALFVSSQPIPNQPDSTSIPPSRFYVFDVTTGNQLSEIISPAETDFNGDGMIDVDRFGADISLDGIGTEMKIAIGAPGGHEGDATTYVYTYNPSPQELVDAGDFETSVSRDLILNAWNRTPGAKLRCGRGVDASCGVKFKSGVSSKITQSVDLSQFPLNPGDGLLFQMDAKVKGTSVVKGKLKVIYADGFSAVVPLRVENTGGVYRRVMTAPAIFIANRPLAKIVVSIKKTAQLGAAFIDNVSLVRAAGSSSR
jgi:hypothetical protein